MKKTTPIRKAIAYIRADAGRIRQACRGGYPERDWSCDDRRDCMAGTCSARADYREAMLIADQLESLLK